MKKRSCEILQNLINQDPTPYVGHFAKLYGVSERTIRADINEINTLFIQLKIPPIKTVENGLIVVNQEVKYKSVLQHIKKMGYYSYKLSPKERQSIIILRLVNRSSFVTMNELSDLLFVSRPTIISDIVEIKEHLKPYEMEIITQAKKGINIHFNETQVRILMVRMLKEYCKNLRRPSVFQNMLITEMSNRFSMDTIYRVLQKMENLLNINFSDEGFHNLLFYLFVAINRFTICDISNDNDLANVEEKEYELASRIYMNLAGELEISIEDKEVISLAEYIKENNIYPLSNNIYDYPDIYVIMANFLYSVFKKLNINLFVTHEYSLFEFLVFHIKALEERLQRNEIIENPYRDQIITEYGNVYTAVKENIYLLEEYLGCNIGQDEMSYITIHICAAIERHNSAIPRLSIVVACPGSMATGQLLAAQIDKHFKFDIRGVIAADHLIGNSKIDKIEIDFIISTVSLPESHWPTVVVNPILQVEDYNRIQTMALSMYKKYEGNGKNNLRSSILNNLSKAMDSAQNQDLSAFQKEVQTFLSEYFSDTTDTGEAPYLFEIIHPNLIITQAHAHNWRDAIRMGGKPLILHGYIKPEYIHLMIENVEENGPYCVLRKGLALAHAQSNKSVFSTGMSLLVLNDGVEFGHEENDPVHLLFCFCVNDSRDYLKALKNLIALSDESDFFSEIFNAKKSDYAYEIIKSRELNLFNFLKEAT